MKEQNQNIEPLKFPVELALLPNLKTLLDIEKIDQHIESITKINPGLEHLGNQMEAMTETLVNRTSILNMKTLTPLSFTLNGPQIIEPILTENHLPSLLIEKKLEEQEKKIDEILEINQDLLIMLRFHMDEERRKYGQSSNYEL